MRSGRRLPAQLRRTEDPRSRRCPPPPWYLRLIDSCITQLNAQGPSRTCNESKEEEKEDPLHPAAFGTRCFQDLTATVGGARSTWRQPRGKTIVSLVNSHTNATRIGWHLWEIDLRFAPGLPPGWTWSSLLPHLSSSLPVPSTPLQPRAAAEVPPRDHAGPP